jgi:hypothetical protein
MSLKIITVAVEWFQEDCHFDIDKIMMDTSTHSYTIIYLKSMLLIQHLRVCIQKIKIKIKKNKNSLKLLWKEIPFGS